MDSAKFQELVKKLSVLAQESASKSRQMGVIHAAP